MKRVVTQASVTEALRRVGFLPSEEVEERQPLYLVGFRRPEKKLVATRGFTVTECLDKEHGGRFVTVHHHPDPDRWGSGLPPSLHAYELGKYAKELRRVGFHAEIEYSVREHSLLPHLVVRAPM